MEHSARMQDFLQHFRRHRGWTRGFVAAIPEEYFGWSPRLDDFTCGGLVRHMIAAEVFWRKLIVAGAAGEPFDPFQLPGDLRARVEAFRAPNVAAARREKYGKSFAECLASWAPIQAETEAALGAIAERNLDRAILHPLAGLRAPAWEMCWGMIDHEAHHRGQLSAYLKMIGVPQAPVIFS